MIERVRGFSVRNIRNMKRFYDFYAQFGICATTVAQLEEKQISATVGAEIETEENQSISAVVQNSATMVAKLQMRIYELITSVGWTQNCIILEKC